MDIFSVIVFVLFNILVLAALIRIIIKMRKGESVHITPVGVNRDLPGDVTGMNKHKE